jgi:hypothetical protein
MAGLEAVDFDGIPVEAEALLLVGEEVLDLAALIALQLDHLAHALRLGVGDDRAIASYGRRQSAWTTLSEGSQERTEFLLDDLQNLLVVELRRNALDRSQGLTSISLWTCVRSLSPD